MSKHHAAEDEPQGSDISWIQGLARPAEAPASQTLPFYRALVARTPRHAEPDEAEPDGAEPDGAEPDQAEPDEVQPDQGGVAVSTGHTGSRRITADQVDSLIGRLDEADEQVAPPPDLGLALFDAPDAPAAAVDSAPAVPAPTGEDVSVTSVVDTAIHGAPVAEAPVRGRLRKPMLVGAAAALCALTLGGGTVAAMDKNVAIVVDGRTQHVSTLAGSVAGALAAAGISAGSHDALAPAGGTAISDGSTIVLDRGRLFSLTVDGQPRQVWTTAQTVDQALGELGARTSNLQLSADRSRAIPIAGLAVTASTVHTVSMTVGAGRSAAQTTTATTVGQLLAQHQIVLAPTDRVTPAPSTALSDGMVVRVDRVVTSISSTTVALPAPAATTVPDATLAQGATATVRPATAGTETITFAVTTINGRQASRVETSRRIVASPVGRLTRVGTKVAPPAPPKSTITYSGSEVFTNDTSFGVNWDNLAMCESTHNPRAINANPSAGLPTYGMFQFDLPTWESVGGSGNPIDASPEEQLMRAKLLYQQRGLEPWACGYAAH